MHGEPAPYTRGGPFKGCCSVGIEISDQQAIHDSIASFLFSITSTGMLGLELRVVPLVYATTVNQTIEQQSTWERAVNV